MCAVQRNTRKSPALQSLTKVPDGGSAPLETDVLIIGGGLAGLTTAMGLRHSGLRVTLVEKSEQLGGRARSWADAKTGDPVHIGPHIFMSKYPNMIKLLEMLGTADHVVWQQPGHFITMVEGQRESEMISDLRLPAPFHFTRSLMKDEAYPMADVASQIPVTMYALGVSEEELLRLDNLNASAFLRSMGVSEYMIQRFWAFACMAIMNVPIDICSAGALLRFYAGLVGISSMQIGFADVGLSDLYVPQIQKIMGDSGMQLITGVGVRTLLGDDTSTRGAQLEDGRVIRAKTVVAALTPMALRHVSRRAWIQRYKVFHELVHFHASPYYSTYLWFDRKLTNKKFWARAFDPNDLNCDFYDMSNINRGWEQRKSVIMTNCIYCDRAEHMTDEEIAMETVRELAEYLPEAAEAKLEHFVVNHIPMAIHCPYPGMEQRRPATVSPVDNLVLAGDWIGTGLPSCMENACYTGWLAAEAVQKAHGLPVTSQSIAFGVHTLEGAAKLWHKVSQIAPLDPVSRLVRTRPNSRSSLVH